MKKDEYKQWDSVMLVDDNDLDNVINRRLLENSNVCDIVYVHTSARSAIEFLKNIERLENGPKLIPNLIILDVDMPLMDGFQFLEEFQEMSDTIQNKGDIIILTSSKNDADFQHAKKYPCVKRFLQKPLTQKDFMSFMISQRN